LDETGGVMETVIKDQERSDILEYKFSSLDDEGSPKLQFEIRGQTGERSYEDRSVYLKVSTTPRVVGELEGQPVSVSHSEPDFNMWLNGEDAIELGLKLIEHGNFAMKSNMITHQAIHTFRQFQGYLDAEIVEEVQFELLDENPPNHGDGFRLYRVTPVWKPHMAPQYNEDFSFEKVIYWSPIEEDYHDMIDLYTQGCAYSIEGYNREAEVRRFEESVRLMSGDFDG
jgi:hypothetical protein